MTFAPGLAGCGLHQQFFEHLPDKAHLLRTLGQIRRCLKPGGCLIAMGPNIKYLPGRYWDFF